jgi:hypothetical protein
MRDIDTKTRHSVMGLLLVAITSIYSPDRVAQAHAPVATDPPEVKKTVDAFLGHRTMTGTYRDS